MSSGEAKAGKSTAVPEASSATPVTRLDTAKTPVAPLRTTVMQDHNKKKATPKNDTGAGEGESPDFWEATVVLECGRWQGGGR